MTRLDPRAVLCAAFLGGVALAAKAPPPVVPEATRYWPQWRGPMGTGEAPHARPPVEWSETRNVRWKVELPGQGKSTPIVWGDLVVVTAAVPTAKDLPARESTPAPGGRAHPDVRSASSAFEFVVLAFGRNDGKLRWRRAVREERPHEGTHRDGTYASGSAATDGKRIYAHFGSRGLYALDLTGRVLWEKNLGVMTTRNEFGEGSSPAVHGEAVVVNWDHEGKDFVAALDASTGRERWRRERDEPTTWATPHVAAHDGRAQVVVNGTNKVKSYDLETGEPLWESAGLTANVIPSPVSGGGLVYTMSGFRGNMLRAVRLDARGEVTGPPAVAWTYERDTPYVPSPLLYRGALYFLKSNSGVLTSLDAASGSKHFMERIEAVPNVYASPVAADGRVYVVGRQGTTVVLAAAPELKVLAANRLDDAFDASPALVDGEIFLRGTRYLYAIGAP